MRSSVLTERPCLPRAGTNCCTCESGIKRSFASGRSVCGDQLEGAEQPVGDRVDVVIAQDSREILEFEPQSPVGRRGDDCQWIVRGILGVVDVENVIPAMSVPRRVTAVDGIRLEDSQGVERCSGAHCRSDVRKPHVMVIGQPRLFRLDANAQRCQGLSRIEAHSDGDGV